MRLRNMILFSIGFVLAIFIIANFIFYIDLPTDVIKLNEGELHKNKGLALLPGERYVYSLGSDLGQIEFEIKLGNNCMGVYINEEYSGVCIDSDGTDETGSNLSFVHPQVIFFKPWMLALEEDWNWDVEYMDKQTDEVILKYIFEVTGEEEILGRECYVVQISGEDLDVTEWIDKEKRVLIKEVGSDYEIILAYAPFELEENSE